MRSHGECRMVVAAVLCALAGPGEVQAAESATQPAAHSPWEALNLASVAIKGGTLHYVHFSHLCNRGKCIGNGVPYLLNSCR